MIQKLGFYTSNAYEHKTGMDIMVDKEIVFKDSLANYDVWPHICLMTKNITVDEYEECLKLSPLLALDSK